MSDHNSDQPGDNHADASDKPYYDDLDTSKITMVGFVGSLIVFLIILVVQVGYYLYEQGVHAVQAQEVTVVEGGSTIVQQKERLQSDGAVDGKPGVYYIPIDTAMQLVVNEEQAKQAKDKADEKKSSGE